MKKITSIDLFAGVGGMRISLQRALNRLRLKDECKLYSEINSYSRKTYDLNFPQTPLIEDIKSVNKNEISSKVPDHDILLAGFPCQPFSRAGISSRKFLKRAHGLDDKDQGDLFFNIFLFIQLFKLIIIKIRRLNPINPLVIVNTLNGKGVKPAKKSVKSQIYIPLPSVNFDFKSLTLP